MIKKMDLEYIIGERKMKLILDFLKMGNNLDLENIFLIIKNQNMGYGVMKIIIKLNGLRILKMFITF